MRDLFSSVFFVAIGMMIDPKLLLAVWPLILGLGVFALAGRAVATLEDARKRLAQLGG